jgi:peptidoglycan/LPS O-acetylase OafA/YrhL
MDTNFAHGDARNQTLTADPRGPRAGITAATLRRNSRRTRHKDEAECRGIEVAGESCETCPSIWGDALKVNERNQSLDVLRGIAILLVLGRHSFYFSLWHRVGWIGVDLFFVLSGFLISGLFFAEFKRTARLDLKRFFIRRGFKIYPPYYFFVLLLLPFTFHQVTAADVTFMQSYFPAFWGHGWSLSIEEHFYVLLPFVLLTSAKLRPRSNFAWIPYALPVLLAFCLLMRSRLGAHATHQMMDATHLHLDALFVGVTLSWMHHFTLRGIRTSHGALLGIVGLALLVPACLFDLESFPMYTWGFTSNLLGFSCILVWALNTPFVAKIPALSTIGRYSYSIYLWHWPIAGLAALMWRNTLASFAAYILAALSVGVAMSEIIEVPMLNLRDRLIPGLSRPRVPELTNTSEVSAAS